MLSWFGESFFSKGYVQVFNEVTSRFPTYFLLHNYCSQSLQLKFVIANRSPLLWGIISQSIAQNGSTTRFPWSWTACSHAWNHFEIQFGCMKLVYMDMSYVFFFKWNKLFPLSKGSSTFSMIFWYILCILPTRLIFNMTRWHECTGCQQWIIITGQEFISYPACKNSMISFSSFISPEKLLSHCLPPLRRW